MARLFIEGLFIRGQIADDKLVNMIENARATKAISTVAYHSASVSRLMGNIGAHYSSELRDIKASDCTTVLDLIHKLAIEIIANRGPLT
jgi:hypothetical protein